MTGGVATLLEWDAKIPPFQVVHDEVLKAKEYMTGDLPIRRQPVALPVTTDGVVPTPLSFIRAEIDGAAAHPAGIY